MKYAPRRIAFMAGFGGLLIVLSAVFTTDKVLGRDVLMIAPHKRSMVELNRMLYVQGDLIPQLYGNPLSEKTRIVLPSKDRLVRPPEDPTLLLFQVDKQQGENPLQTQTIWFFTKFIVPGLALLGLLGFALPRNHHA